MPEPDLLREFLGDPGGRIKCPTVAQEMLFGAKGRVFQLRQYLTRHAADFADGAIGRLRAFLDANAEAVEKDNAGELVANTLAGCPRNCAASGAGSGSMRYEKGTRQRVPALVDVDNPGLTGGVQNQPDFQAGSVDHRTHFVNEVPHFVREAMEEYSQLTGREYKPVMTYMCDDAENVMVGLGSVTDDAQAVADLSAQPGQEGRRHLDQAAAAVPRGGVRRRARRQEGGHRAGALGRDGADQLRHPGPVQGARERRRRAPSRHPGARELPKITTAIFGLGAHDLQPRHLIAAFKNMETRNAPLVYLGSQFFSKNPTPKHGRTAGEAEGGLSRDRADGAGDRANPTLLPKGAFRIRFHSVGGYGTIATGKLLTDILAGVLDLHSKAAPKYGSEKSGAPTNYYITLSPEPVLITNAELEDVEIVVSPDHKVFSHSNPLRGLVEGGTFILQSNLPPLEVWKELPAPARKTIRDKKIKFFVIDAFEVAKRHAPTPELETRMMGIAFIGAVCGNFDRVADGAPRRGAEEDPPADLARSSAPRAAPSSKATWR